MEKDGGKDWNKKEYELKPDNGHHSAACGVILVSGRHFPLYRGESMFPNIHSGLVNRSSIDVSRHEWFHL